MKNYNTNPLKVSRKYAPLVEETINSLYEIPVACYLNLGIENPETVGKHTDSCIAIAKDLFQIPGLNYMLKVHDWSRIDQTLTEDRPAKTRFMIKLCFKLGCYGPLILFFWNEYYDRITPRAKLAWQINQFQKIMRMIEYQKAGEAINAQEFINLHGDEVTNSTLRNIILKAKIGL